MGVWTNDISSSSWASCLSIRSSDLFPMAVGADLLVENEVRGSLAVGVAYRKDDAAVTLAVSVAFENP